MENSKYWIDDDGYIAHGRDDEYATVSGYIEPLHIQPLSAILESHTDLLEACHALNEHLGHYIRLYEDQYPHTFSVVDMQEGHKKMIAAIKKATN